MGNRVCQLLGIKYPIIQGPMLRISGPTLAAAVSNAGGLGMLSGAQTPDSLRRELSEIRRLTDKPFGVNLPIALTDLEEIRETMAILIEGNVPIVSTSAGNPEKAVPLLKQAGFNVIHVIGSVKHAKMAESVDADAVIASGFEAGGLLNPDQVTTLTLLPQVADALSIPVIAAGGIADARGFVAALALGAEGVQLGTRFIATDECEAHILHKKSILKSTDTSTEVIRQGRNLARYFKQELIYEIWGTRQISIEHKRAGQIAGLIKEVVDVDEVMRQLITGSALIIAGLCNTISKLSLSDNVESMD